MVSINSRRATENAPSAISSETRFSHAVTSIHTPTIPLVLACRKIFSYTTPMHLALALMIVGIILVVCGALRHAEEEELPEIEVIDIRHEL